jgi:hypothetical protein
MRMFRQSSPLTRLLAVATIAAISALTPVAAWLTPVAARTPVSEAQVEEVSLSEAEEMFSDAAFGVDPMVTGPVSDEFQQRQRDLGCAEAKWPDIPAGCYPR